jgi:flagellar motor switch protein FliG
MPNPKKSDIPEELKEIEEQPDEKQGADLKRFKKTMDGLIEFATLLEQASPSRRQKIMSETVQTDPEFLRSALRKVVYFEELIFIDEGILAEILSKTSSRLLAYAIKKSTPEFKQHMLKHLSYIGMKQTIDEEDQIRENVSDEFVLGAQRQILKIARMLEKQSRFVFELADCPRFQGKKKAA